MNADPYDRRLSQSAASGKTYICAPVYGSDAENSTIVKLANKAVPLHINGHIQEALTLWRDIAGRQPQSVLEKILAANALTIAGGDKDCLQIVKQGLLSNEAGFDHFLQSAAYFFNTGRAAEARQALMRAVSFSPPMPALTGLLRITADMKFYDIALKAITDHGRASAEEPEYQLEKARIYISTQQRDAALTAAINAANRLGLTAQTAAALGGAAIINNRQDIMGQCYEYAHALPDKQRAAILYRWAEDCYGNGFYNRAAMLLKPLVEHDPANRRLRIFLASNLLSAGQTTGVDHLLRPIIKADPHNTEALIEYARFCFLTGDTGGARSAAAVVLDNDPLSVAALRILADIRADNIDPDIISGFEEVLARQHLAPRQASHIAYSLGVHYEQRSDFKNAFSKYQSANQHQQKSIGEKFRSGITDKITRFEAANDLLNVASSPQVTELAVVPVFIIGLPRSGTTLVEQILSMHPDIWAGGERPEIPFWLDEGLRCKNEKGASAAREWMQSQRETWRRGFLRPKNANALAVTDKTPGNIEHLAFIKWLLPEARIVYVTREPRDVATSIFAAPIRDAVTWAAGMENILDYYRFSLDCLEAAPDMNTISVSYENLVADIEHETRRILSFCGLSWSGECLNFTENARPVNTLSATQVRQPLYTTSIGRWRKFADSLSEWENSFIELEKRQSEISLAMNS